MVAWEGKWVQGIKEKGTVPFSFCLLLFVNKQPNKQTPYPLLLPTNQLFLSPFDYCNLFVCQQTNKQTRSMLCSFLLLFITKEKRAVFLSPFVYCLKEKGTQQLMIIDDNCINYRNNKQKNMLTKEKCAVFLSPFVYCLKEKGTHQLMIIDDKLLSSFLLQTVCLTNKQTTKQRHKWGHVSPLL